MDLLEACENLVCNIASFDPFETPDTDIPKTHHERWQKLFNMTEGEAIKEIQEWRADFGRLTISQPAWQDISNQKAGEGFDKESYEYSLSTKWLRRLQKQKCAPDSTAIDSHSTYLLKLEGCISDVASVQRLAELPTPPEAKQGQGDDSTELFCVIDGVSRHKLLQNLQREGQSFHPVMISLSKARKDLSPGTAYPTLGLDTTLPHNRPSLKNESFRPENTEYPVWYFVYGTLGDAEVMRRLLGPDRPISYAPARILGGRLGTWANKYKALVDSHADTDKSVEGYGFLVQNKDEEDALRYYETSMYEVVRCEIQWLAPCRSSDSTKGLTFRYTGSSLERDWYPPSLQMPKLSIVHVIQSIVNVAIWPPWPS